MDQKKVGIIVIVLSLLFGGLLVYTINSLGARSSALNCNPSQECQSVSSGISTSHFAFGAVSAALALGFYLLIFNNRSEYAILQRLEEEKDKKVGEERFSLLLKGLDDFEKNVVSAVKEQQGITQATLRLRTKLSKAKLSRVLQTLEQKNIVSKEPNHKTNSIYLVDSWC